MAQRNLILDLRCNVLLRLYSVSNLIDNGYMKVILIIFVSISLNLCILDKCKHLRGYIVNENKQKCLVKTCTNLANILQDSPRKHYFPNLHEFQTKTLDHNKN